MEPDPFAWILEACQDSSSDITNVENGSDFEVSDSDSYYSEYYSRSNAALRNAVNSDAVMLPALFISENEEVFHTPPVSRSTAASSDNCNDSDNPVVVDCEAVANSGGKRKRVTEEEEDEVSKRLKAKAIESPAMSDTDTEELLEWFKNSDPSPEGTPETDIQNLQNHGSNFEIGEGSVRVRASSHEGWDLGKRVLPSWANPGVASDAEGEIKETNLPPSVKGSVGDGERVEQEPVHPSTASGPSRENHDGVNDVDVLLQLGKDGDYEEQEKPSCVATLGVAERKWGPF